jgi:hypothetical protein
MYMMHSDQGMVVATEDLELDAMYTLLNDALLGIIRSTGHKLLFLMATSFISFPIVLLCAHQLQFGLKLELPLIRNSSVQYIESGISDPSAQSSIQQCCLEFLLAYTKYGFTNTEYLKFRKKQHLLILPV